MPPAAMMTNVFPTTTASLIYKKKHKKMKNIHHYDNSTTEKSPGSVDAGGDDAVPVQVLTVWKKSLLFNCNGFTVFDGSGNLLYRVDNYLAGNRGEIVLMDVDGKPLLTIRRKRFSLGDSWMVYEGEKTTTSDPKLCVRKHANLPFNTNKTLAQVTSLTTATTSSHSDTCSSPPKKNVVLYEVEGSYAQRTVSVYDTTKRCVSQIRKKEAVGGVPLGVDVFNLVVSTNYMDNDVAMAIVILLDQMFGSSSSSAATL